MTGYTVKVKIRNILHKGVRRLYEADDPRGLPLACVDKVRKMIAYLENMAEAEELRSVPVWKAHLLAGDRKGMWTLHVTRNWRMTFRIDHASRAICDLNFEDYH